MTIGMAVDAGHEREKQQLAALLLEASRLASGINLWFNGKPAPDCFIALARQLGGPGDSAVQLMRNVTATVTRFTDPPTVMSNETMAKATALLVAQGIDATFEYPGFIAVRFTRSDGSGTAVPVTIHFGINGDMFGGDIYDSPTALEYGEPSDYIETRVPRDSENPELVASTIAAIVEGTDATA